MSPAPTVRPPAAERRLSVGEPLGAPGWIAPDGTMFTFNDDRYVGRMTALAVCAAPGDPAADAALARFAAEAAAFEAAGAQVFAVTGRPPGENAGLAARLGLPFPVLGDPSFAVGRALGLAAGAKGAAGVRTVVLDRNLRVERLIGPGEPPEGHAAAALAACAAAPAAPDRVVRGPVAPVLVVTRVLEPEHCRRLMRIWEDGEPILGAVDTGSGTRGLVSRETKIRRDVFLANGGPEAQEIVGIFRARLFPEIQKAFHFRVTRSETLRIGCYDAREQGRFRAHRDDTAQNLTHRRFAMSLNLNAGEYEGGCLRFPEYGDQLFDVEPGGAVVFSCALLHEAMPVTAGRRFGMFAFYYGEAEERARRERDPSAPEAMLVDTPRG